MKEVDETNHMEENRKAIIENNKKEFVSRIMGSGDPTQRMKPVHASGVLDFGKEKIFFQTIFVPNGPGYKPVVVTSRGNVIEVDEAESSFEYNGERFKFRSKPFYVDGLGINTVDFDFRTEHPSKGIYEEAKARVTSYFDHHNKYEYDIITSYVVQTFLLRVLGRTFYLVLQGRENTGKSTIQKVVAKLQFNGMFMGKGTVAVTSRLIDCLNASLNQDEFDKMGKDEKKYFIAQANTGLYADGTYVFTDMNRSKVNEQIRVLYTFSARSFSANSLHEFDRSFLSRCYVSVATRQSRPLKDINSLSAEDENAFRSVRNGLFMYCLFNWEQMRQDIADMKSEIEKEGCFGRKADMYSIILGVIRHFKSDYYNEVKSYLKEREGVEEEDRKGTYETIVFEYLLKKASSMTIIEVSNRELYGHLLEELGIEPDAHEKKPAPQMIGWILKNHGLIERNENLRRAAKGNRIYVIRKDDLVDRLRRFGYLELFHKPEDSQNQCSVSSGSSDSAEGFSEEIGQTEEPEHGLLEEAEKFILQRMGDDEIRMRRLKDEFLDGFPGGSANFVLFWSAIGNLKSHGVIFEARPNVLKRA